MTVLFIGIEGNPFITRFKTNRSYFFYFLINCIEGNPFITRFKTVLPLEPDKALEGIEGNPFITRFKTLPKTLKPLPYFLY